MTSVFASEFDIFVKSRMPIPDAANQQIATIATAKAAGADAADPPFFGHDPTIPMVDPVASSAAEGIDVVYLIGIKYKTDGILKICQLHNKIGTKTLKSCVEQMISAFDTDQEYIYRFQYNFKEMRFREKCYIIYCLFNETNTFLPIDQNTRPLVFLGKKPNGLPSKKFDDNQTFDQLSNIKYDLNGKPLSCIQMINQYKNKTGGDMKKNDQSTNYYFELYVAQQLENGDNSTPYEIVIFDPTTGNDGPS